MWETGWPIWQRVIQFDPSPPSWTYWTAFHYQFNAGNFEEALRYSLILKHESGDYFHWLAATEASTLAHLGRLGEAEEALARAVAKKPESAETARAEAAVWWGNLPEYVDRMMDGLYKAGLERQAVETQ